MSVQNDSDLLLAYIQRGDETAFTTLVQRHADLVFGSALRQLGDRGAAEEVTQNVFTALARKARWLTGEGGLAGWLYRTAILEVRFRQRTDDRRRQREQAAIELGTTMKPDDSLLRSLVPLLDDGLMELSEKDRHALVSRFLEGKSFRDVGAVLGTREDAAQKRVSKGLDQLTRFFRNRGYTAVTAGIVARTLEAAYVATPSELVTSVASGALAAGTAGTLTTAGILIAKFMGMTKLQTAVLCVLISAAPVGYEWNAAAQMGSERASLKNRFIQSQRQLETERRQHAHLERRLQAANDSISAARRELARLRDVIAIARAGKDSGLFLWSEDSDYVRLPKSLATQIMLSGSHELPPGTFPPQRDQDAPVMADGSLSEALGAALGVTEIERDALGRAFEEFTAKFREADAARTYTTNTPPAEFQVGNWPSQTVVTQAALPAESEETRESFRTELVDILGSERAAVLWKQAEALFRESFSDFGALERVETVAFHSGRELSTWQSDRPPGDSRFVSWGSSSGSMGLESIPEKLRPLVVQWRARNPESQDALPTH